MLGAYIVPSYFYIYHIRVYCITGTPTVSWNASYGRKVLNTLNCDLVTGLILHIEWQGSATKIFQWLKMLKFILKNLGRGENWRPATKMKVMKNDMEPLMVCKWPFIQIIGEWEFIVATPNSWNKAMTLETNYWWVRIRSANPKWLEQGKMVWWLWL